MFYLFYVVAIVASCYEFILLTNRYAASVMFHRFAQYRDLPQEERQRVLREKLVPTWVSVMVLWDVIYSFWTLIGLLFSVQWPFFLSLMFASVFLFGSNPKGKIIHPSRVVLDSGWCFITLAMMLLCVYKNISLTGHGLIGGFLTWIVNLIK